MTTRGIKTLVTLCAIIYCSQAGIEKQMRGTRSGKVFYMGDYPVNFFEAFLQCQAGGLTLAAINTKEEENDLLDFIKDEKGQAGDIDGFWLSGTNLANPNSTTFYWLSGGKRALYTNWLPGEPNNSDGKENCLHWRLLDGRTGWNDYNCYFEVKYICQDME